ncbi:MAG: leucine-rich repeat protein, partial [Clostridiales bacterium]|nr:leucine-rich repeat protein [Clostridiales bacterium]
SIGINAFYGCSSLTSVTINSEAVVSGTFSSSKSSLTDVTIGDSVTTIPSSVFYEFKNLTSVTIGSSVTSIGSYAFYYCTSLTSVTIPDSVTSIGSYAFYNCKSLTELTLGKGVTSIGSYAFSGCTGLTEMTLGEGVTSIGSNAFYGCTGLTDVYYAGSEEEWAAISIASGNTYLKNATIHYNYVPTVDLSTCTVTVASATYTGSALTPAVTVKDASGNTLTSGTDYTVKYTNNTNVGTGTVTVTGTGNYTGSVSKTFTIAKASQTVTATAAATSIYAGKTTTVTGAGVGTITYSSSDASVATVSSAGKVTGKKPGTVTITVKAAGNSNYNAASKTVKITVKLNKTTISSLTNTSKGVTVKWSKVTGASGYYIYRNGTKVKTITSGSTVSYTDTGAKTNGTKYQYKIYAYNGSTKSAASATKTTYYVSSPTISSLKNSASKKMTVKWGKNTKATGYQIQYSTSSSFSSYKTVTVTSASTVSKTISSLTKGKKYYVRVRAYKTVSGTKYYSAWISTKSVKISK